MTLCRIDVPMSSFSFLLKGMDLAGAGSGVGRRNVREFRVPSTMTL